MKRKSHLIIAVMMFVGSVCFFTACEKKNDPTPVELPNDAIIGDTHLMRLVDNDGFMAPTRTFISRVENDFLIELNNAKIEETPDELFLVIENQSTNENDTISMMIGAAKLEGDMLNQPKAVRWFRVLTKNSLGEYENVPASILAYREGNLLGKIEFKINTTDEWPTDGEIRMLEFTNQFYDYDNTIQPSVDNTAPFLNNDLIPMTGNVGDRFYIACRVFKSVPGLAKLEFNRWDYFSIAGAFCDTDNFLKYSHFAILRNQGGSFEIKEDDTRDLDNDGKSDVASYIVYEKNYGADVSKQKRFHIELEQ